MRTTSRSLLLLGLSTLGVAFASAALAACSSDDSSNEASDGSAPAPDASAGHDGSAPSGDDGGSAVPTPPDPSGLGLSCTTSADCQLIDEPVNCQETVCDCPGIAVNNDAAASWNSELTSYAAACRAAAGDAGLVACGVDCVYVQAACCGGTCMAVPGNTSGPTCPNDAGADAAADASADASADAGDAS